MNLKVLLSNEIIFESPLDKQQEYIAGRGSDCDIPLKGVRGVSRQHVKIFHNGNQWSVELLSQYGGLIHNELNCDQLELEDNDQFNVNEFLFIFESSSSIQSQSSQKSISSDSYSQEYGSQPSDIVISQVESSYRSPSSIELETEATEDGNLESTSPGQSILDVELTIEYPSGESDKIKLEGNAWIAGRDPNCEIYIRNDNISRKHFEIIRQENGIFVMDLGSSNGTCLNQEQLNPQELYKLESGDTISIKKVTLMFYLKNNQLNEMMQSIQEQPMQVPATLNSPQDAPLSAPAPHSFEIQPSVEKIQAAPFNIKDVGSYETKHKIRLIAFVLFPFIAYLLLSDAPQEKSMATKTSNSSNPYDGLSPEQKSSVKHSLELAQSNYNRGQFKACLAEVQKINNVVPGYKDSKNLGVYCQNGLELKSIQADKVKREEERLQVEEKVRAVTAVCQARVNTFNTVEEAELCLSDAMELNPDAPEIYEITSTVQAKIDALKASQQQKLMYANQKAQGEKLYRRAAKKYREKDLKTASKYYKRFLASNYPDPRNNKGKARKTLKTINQELSILINDGLRECKALLTKKNYKQAMLKCQKIEKQDPGNKKIAETKALIRKTLSFKMKEFYDNASIEESFGNIEVASELWKKIIATDFKGGSGFYEKSKSKMKKYGM